MVFHDSGDCYCPRRGACWPRLRQPATSTLFREKHSLLRGFPSKLSPGCAVRRTSILKLAAVGVVRETCRCHRHPHACARSAVLLGESVPCTLPATRTLNEHAANCSAVLAEWGWDPRQPSGHEIPGATLSHAARGTRAGSRTRRAAVGKGGNGSTGGQRRSADARGKARPSVTLLCATAPRRARRPPSPPRTKWTPPRPSPRTNRTRRVPHAVLLARRWRERREVSARVALPPGEYTGAELGRALAFALMTARYAGLPRAPVEGDTDSDSSDGGGAPPRAPATRPRRARGARGVARSAPGAAEIPRRCRSSGSARSRPRGCCASRCAAAPSSASSSRLTTVKRVTTVKQTRRRRPAGAPRAPSARRAARSCDARRAGCAAPVERRGARAPAARGGAGADVSAAQPGAAARAARRAH